MDLLAVASALALVLLNAFFVATEFSIVKLRPTRIEELIRKQRPGAQAVRRILGSLDGYLSATQLGVTLASLGLGWLGEPAFSRILSAPLIHMGLAESYWAPRIAAALAFLLISFLHIVVGELAPKSIAIRRPESVALAVALPMRLFHIVFFPAIWALNGLSNALLRLMGMGTGHGLEQHSEEEIKIILNQARSAGLLSGSRSELLAKVLSLPQKTARHIMIPRNEVVVLDINLTVTENLARARAAGHTRFPLCNRELDDVIGVLDIRDLLYAPDREALDLRKLAAESPYFPELMSAERLLAEFRSRHATMAVVVDEYGGASGIVTPADVVTAVMGELDEDDEPELVALPGGAFEVEGIALLEEVEESLRITLNRGNTRTLAGFLMEQLGRMPRAGDRITAAGYTFHVAEIAGPKVKRVRIQREPSLERPPSHGAARPHEKASRNA